MKTFTAFLGAIVLASVTGCGASAAQYCTDLCDCTGCSDSDEQRCEKETDDALKNADDQGCGSQADDYLNCVVDGAECIESDYVVGGCDSELKSLGNCVD